MELSPQRFLALVAKVGSPIALGTALLFYFGWVRADAQARALGYDVTLLGLNTSDYVLRSVSVLFIPIVILILLALGFYALHPLLLRALETSASRSVGRWFVGFLRFAWIWCVLAGGIVFSAAPGSRTMVIPIALTIGILLSIYGDRLNRHLTSADPPPSVVTGLVLLLLGVVVFWDVERLAGLMGRGVADFIATNPSSFAQISVLSDKSLEMNAAGIKATALGSEASAYRYRYDGLRLLLHSNGKHFLLAYAPDGGSPRVVVLRDSEALRVEFAR